MSDITNWVRLFAVVVFLLIVLPPLFRNRPKTTDAGQQERKREAREYQGFEDGPPATPPHSPTVTTETHAEWIGVPCDAGLDMGRIDAALNRQDTSVTDHRDQDDDHPGPSWGIIR
jgi:hypothetical protein